MTDKLKRFESYFLMWDSVLFYPNPENIAHVKQILYKHSGDVGSIPCWQHRTCQALVRVVEKTPPRVCPHCHADTAKEQKAREERGESQGDPREASRGIGQT